MNNKTKNIMLYVLTILLICTMGVFVWLTYFKKEKVEKPSIEPNNPIVETTNKDFDYKILKEVNAINKDKNYMISPLSIAYALSILNDGANNNTKKEIETVLNNYELGEGINIPSRVGIANALFINNSFKNKVLEEYTNKIKTNYSADIIFDDFKNADTINNWANEKTYNMIPDLLKEIDSNVVLVIVNAIAIDVKWKNVFECNMTNKEEFTKQNNEKIDTIMMHEEGNTYIENDKAKGIIKDYALYDKTTGETTNDRTNAIELEYIAILPNGDLKEYMSSFDGEELRNLMSKSKSSGENTIINLSLPRYKFDYNYSKFKESLQNIGVKEAFDPNNSDLSGISKEFKLYIEEAIHKTHIELNENGTKASALTALLSKNGAILNDNKQEIINIKFNKPFMYLIKEKNNNNIWFVGAVYEPETWKSDTVACDESI